MEEVFNPLSKSAAYMSIHCYQFAAGVKPTLPHLHYKGFFPYPSACASVIPIKTCSMILPANMSVRARLTR